MNEEENERDGSQRPKVVDKRISARRAAGETIGSTPSPQRPAPDPASGSGGGPSIVPPRDPRGDLEDSRAQHPAGRSAAPEPAGTPGAAQAGEVWTPEQEAEAQRMIEEIAATPSLEWVVQAAVSLANVAGTKLEAGAGADAQLAIDALAGIVNGVGSRLAGAEQPLRQTLAQLQLAYAQTIGGIAPPVIPEGP